MPIVTAQIRRTDGGQIAPTDTATFQITTSFPQHMRPDGAVVVQTQKTPANAPSVQPAGQAWTAPFASIFGGLAALNWTFNGTAQQPANFCILGTNPDFATASALISGGSYWMAKNIGVHETNTSNFCEVGRLQSGKYCSKSENDRWPAWGPPGGYGIMQTDPPPSLDAIWNWRTSIQAGMDRLNALAGPVRDTSNTSGKGTDPSAYAFWIRQVKQWYLYNKQNSGSPVAAPLDQVESSCRFGLAAASPPQYTTPTGQSNAYWFGDAILIKQYGGAATKLKNANYLSWNNVNPTQAPFWDFFKPNKVSSNVVFEVCSCATNATCQHIGGGQ